jgi:septal ring factor EnvC (AmiA/AmiB activator)
MTTPTVGNGRVPFSWVAGVLIGLLTLVGGSLLTAAREDVGDLRRTVQQKAEETAALRAEVGALHTQLTRIEAKLDRLVEGGR